MKKLFFLILSLFLLNEANATYSRTTTNCSWTGCYKTSDKTDDDDNRTIVCSDPGWSNCPSSFSQGGSGNPIELAIANDLLQIAISEISNGNLSGSHTLNGHTVLWNSDNTNMSNSSIVIN